MTSRARGAFVAAAVLVASLVAVVPVASARVVTGSFLYSKGGNIHLAHADGSHNIVFKSGGWSWPSMSNNGVIAAVKQDRVYRFRQNGTQLSRQGTPKSRSNSVCPANQSFHVSLSPDGSKVAYDYSDCNDTYAAWTSATQFSLHKEAGFYAPSWMTSTQLTVSHVGPTVIATQPEVATLTTGGSSFTRSTDIADDWATAYHGAASRDGTKFALIEDDAANQIDGVPHQVALVFGTSTGRTAAITPQCSISLRAAQFSTWGSSDRTNLSFRPDGKVLAFDTQVGIYKVNTSQLVGCTAASLNKTLWIRGGTNPSFSAGTDTRG